VDHGRWRHVGLVSPEHDELHSLDEAACRSRLAAARVGRIAVTDRALPLIIPVACACIGQDIVVRLVPGALDRAADTSQVVCFQTDAADWTDGSDSRITEGWSVEAIGQLRRIDDPAVVESCRQLRTWGRSDGPFAVLSPEVLTGRSHAP
jgi:uncharacterized protein